MVPSAGARIHYEFRSESYSQPPSTSNPSERDPSPAHSAGRSDPQTSKTPLLSFPPAPALIPRPAAFAVLRHRAQQLTGRSLFRVLGTGWWFRMVLSAGARIHFGSRSGSHWPPSTSNPPECDPSLPMPTLFGDPTRRLPFRPPAPPLPPPFLPPRALSPRPAAFAVLRHCAQQLGRSLFRPCFRYGFVFRMVPSAGARIHYGFRSESHWPPSTSNPPERDPFPPLLCPLCWAIRPADTGHIILRRSLPPLPSPRSLLEPVMLPIRPLTLPSFCRQATQSTRE